MKIPSKVSIMFDIDLFDDYKRIGIQGERRAWDIAGEWVDAIGKLNGVYETCNSHMVWARCHAEARTYEGLRGEVDRLLSKIDRLHARYLKKAAKVK